MDEVEFPLIDATRLNQFPNVFYDRLNPMEAGSVKELTGNLRDYMYSKLRKNFLIAGVGGILRLEDPKKANDIDLAVVGFRYSPIGKHNFHDVVLFTQEVQEYFERFNIGLTMEQGIEGRITYLSGSGPLGKLDIINDFEDGIGSIVSVKSELGEFGRYNSKGFQISLKDIKPIDVQFVFNRTPEEWKSEQQIGLYERRSRSVFGYSDNYYY